MSILTTKFPTSTPARKQEATLLKLVNLLERAKDHLDQNNLVKSITIKDKDFTLTIKPNGKA
jgi:hypothetical protein